MTTPNKKTGKKAPKGLGRYGLNLWKQTINDWDIADAPGLTLLESACRLLDRLRDAQQQLDREGTTFRDRWNQVRVHPCVEIERQCSAELRACLKALELQQDPPGPVGRPPGGDY